MSEWMLERRSLQARSRHDRYDRHIRQTLFR